MIAYFLHRLLSEGLSLIVKKLTVTYKSFGITRNIFIQVYACLYKKDVMKHLKFGYEQHNNVSHTKIQARETKYRTFYKIISLYRFVSKIIRKMISTALINSQIYLEWVSRSVLCISNEHWAKIADDHLSSNGLLLVGWLTETCPWVCRLPVRISVVNSF